MRDPIILLDQKKVSRVTGIPRTTMNDWERKGIFKPSFHERKSRGPFSKWYSFRDVVSLKAIARIRREGNVSLAEIKKAGEYFSRWYSEPWSSLKVGSLSGRLVFFNPSSGEWEGLAGQRSIKEIVINEIPSQIMSEIPALTERSSEDLGKIVKLRNVNGNRPVFAGTRVMVSSVRNLLERGYDDERILYEFPVLVPSDIDALRDVDKQSVS